ncbi:poly(ADP-ribose) glycohydrolase [Entamoeba marina]
MFHPYSSFFHLPSFKCLETPKLDNGTYVKLPCYDSSIGSIWLKVFSLIQKQGDRTPEDILLDIYKITLKTDVTLHVFDTLPTNEREKKYLVKLTRIQVASLLSLAFVGLINSPPNFQYAQYFSTCFWFPCHSTRTARALSYMAYFEGISTFLETGQHAEEQVVLQRCYLETAPKWKSCKTEIRLDTEVFNEKSISDQVGCLEADFANEMIGGGVLNLGNVQEEIMFTKNTESLVSLLLCSRMADEDCIKMSNVLEYSTGKGYGSNYVFIKSTYDQHVSHDFVALDALPIAFSGIDQFTKQSIERELNKCYIAVRVSNDESNPPPFATGKWGCGAFGGDYYLKFLIQLCACSLAGRKMIFHTFYDNECSIKLENFLEGLKKQPITIKQLYNLMINLKKM